MNNELDPFYKDLIYNFRRGGGWAQYYYGVFSSIIRENNFKTCVEVGIGYGFHATEILENTNVEKLYLVDPMQYYPNDLFAEDVIKYGGFDNLVKNIKLHLTPYEQRYTWYRCPSLSITNEQIEDGSVDAIFIDGDHSYDAVSKDLVFWWKKLKVGGWLLGDDYNSSFIGTTQAVNEFAANNNLKLEFLSKNNTGYPIYKFVKH